MPTIDLNYQRAEADPKKYGEGYHFNSLTHDEFKKFNPEVLGLGSLGQDGKYINALTAFLDLKGFTEFCNQVDSHLVIPEFMEKYLKWLFDIIAGAFIEGTYKDHIKIWGSLPFMSKFLGDGILFIWNTDHSKGFNGLKNIVERLMDITEAYSVEFYPLIQKSVSKAPSKLRCGIARGQIISIGNGEDFVGSSINIASRLQKLSLLSFAVSRRGFDLEKGDEHILTDFLVLKKYSIRGIGDDELIYVLRTEFDNLPPDEKAQFTNT